MSYKILMKNQFIYTFSLLLLFSCQNGYDRTRLEVDIYNAIEKECSSSNECIINLSNITSFDWDELYIINAGTQSKDISKIIGIEYPVNDNYTRRRYFFLKDGKIVYKEDIRYDPSAPIIGTITFGNPYELPKYSVYKKNSLFKVSEVKGSESHFYILEYFIPTVSLDFQFEGQ